MLNQSPDRALDGARLVRSELQKTAPGARLMQFYVSLSESREVETIIAGDRLLLGECLAFAKSVADRGHHESTGAVIPALATSVPRFERIVDAVSGRCSSRTQVQLAEVRGLVREIAGG